MHEYETLAAETDNDYFAWHRPTYCDDLRTIHSSDLASFRCFGNLQTLNYFPIVQNYYSFIIKPLHQNPQFRGRPSCAPFYLLS